MLQNPTWLTSDRVARAQFAMFDLLAGGQALSVVERRALLGLDVSEWAAWTAFAKGGPVPAAPSVPDMLIRLGVAAHRLSAPTETPARLAA